MLSSLLATVPTIVPTATPTPATTVVPTAVQSILPTVTAPIGNVVSGWDKADVVGSIALGIAAVAISIFALAKTLQQNKKDEAMRKQEAKIAVIEQMSSIYNFFFDRISDEDYFDFSDENIILKRFDELDKIDNLARLIFARETFEKIYLETGRIGLCFNFKYLPFIKDVNVKYLTNADITSDFLAIESSGIQLSIRERKINLIKVIRKNIGEAFEKYGLGL